MDGKVSVSGDLNLMSIYTFALTFINAFALVPVEFVDAIRERGHEWPGSWRKLDGFFRFLHGVPPSLRLVSAQLKSRLRLENALFQPALWFRSPRL